MQMMELQGRTVLTQGRVLMKENKLYLSHSNTKVTFAIRGEQVQLACLTNHGLFADYACLNIYVDGAYVKSVAFGSKTKVITISELSSDGLHEITLEKISEATTNWIAVESIKVENGEWVSMSLPANRVNKVLFLGDSITCGYGLYDGSMEDGSKSYAYLAMQQLGWDAEYICASGFGVYQDYAGDTGRTIPKVYPYISYFVDKTILYDKIQFVPDYIVVYLGTNDSYHLHIEALRQAFLEHYEQFLLQLHEDYPSARVLLLAGTMTDSMNQMLQDLVTSLQIKLPLSYLQFDLQNERQDGVVKNDHPSELTHRKMAAKLVEQLLQIEGEYK